MIEVTDRISLDPGEIQESFIRASGPGGQHVNKVSTAVQIRFDIRHSPSLPNDVRRRAERLAGSRLTLDGVIVLTASGSRSREQNRAEARERLVALLQKAASPPVRRKPTRPTLGSKKRRLESKAKRGAVKKLRRPGPADG